MKPARNKKVEKKNVTSESVVNKQNIKFIGKFSIDKKKMIHFLRVGVIVVLVVGIFVSNIMANSVNAKSKENSVVNSQEIESLTNELNNIKNQDMTHVSEILQQWSDATRLGNAIAVTQNSYSNISANDTAYFSKLSDVADKMRTYMGDSNGAEPWYDYETIKTKWVFKTDYGFLGESITVMWYCLEENTGYLMAYATGLYNAETQLVTGLKVHLTSLGSSYIPATDSELQIDAPVETDSVKGGE